MPWAAEGLIFEGGSIYKRNNRSRLPSNSENKPKGLYFSKALFKGLIYGGAYLRREICVSKSIGLAV